MTAVEIADRTRAEQGLPERVEDPAALARVVALVLKGGDHAGA